ncbi:MAG: dihydrodipicolinate synthase family protein [Acidimicrobiales bacterium]|nr:dihydrodipicolinate synthase family protein [Acidimicrobiales bacterium]
MASRPRPRPPFRGVGVSLITLFAGDGSLDARATTDLARELVDLGVTAVVAADLAGEGPALSLDERAELIDALRRALDETDGVPLIAAAGAPSTRQAVQLTVSACAHGADALLVLSPPFAADPDPYYDEVVRAAGGVPVIAAHHPLASWPGLDMPDLLDLPAAGVEDVTGDADRLLETLEVFEGPLYTGSAALLSFAGPLGVAGAIVALANAEPERCANAFGGDGEEQRALTKAYIEAEVEFPAGIKELTAKRFGTSTVSRMG